MFISERPTSGRKVIGSNPVEGTFMNEKKSLLQQASSAITGAGSYAVKKVFEETNNAVSAIGNGGADLVVDQVTSVGKTVAKKLKEKGYEDCKVSVGVNFLNVQIQVDAPLEVFLKDEEQENEMS